MRGILKAISNFAFIFAFIFALEASPSIESLFDNQLDDTEVSAILSLMNAEAMGDFIPVKFRRTKDYLEIPVERAVLYPFSPEGLQILKSLGISPTLLLQRFVLDQAKSEIESALKKAIPSNHADSPASKFELIDRLTQPALGAEISVSFYHALLRAAGKISTTEIEVSNDPPPGAYPQIPRIVLPKLGQENLKNALRKRIQWVDRFRVAQEMAKKLGLKIYLFGGTASSFANYVRWDLLREAGRSDILSERFNYEIETIFKATQDMDFIIDGPQERIQGNGSQLETKLQKLFSEKRVDVQALNARYKNLRGQLKEPVNNNPDYLRQNNDSLSSSLISLDPDESNFSFDLRSKDLMLQDLSLGRIRFFESESHFENSRARNGDNPPLLSVIRFLTKLLRYDLWTDDESMKKIRRILSEVKANQLQNPYVQYWIEPNSVKLVLHAADLARASDLLNFLDLQKVLQAFLPRNSTLMYWLGRRVLRNAGSYKLSYGSNTIITHGTMGLAAMQSITANPFGIPNFFVSRTNQNNEAAASGEGTYFILGKQGAPNYRVPYDNDSREFHIRVMVAKSHLHTEYSGGSVVLLNSGKASLSFIPDWQTSMRVLNLRQKEREEARKALIERLEAEEAQRKALEKASQEAEERLAQSIRDALDIHEKGTAHDREEIPLGLPTATIENPPRLSVTRSTAPIPTGPNPQPSVAQGPPAYEPHSADYLAGGGYPDACWEMLRDLNK